MNFAIIGASGNVGRKTIEILEKSKIAFKELYLVASKKSAGKKIKFRGEEIVIENLESYDFSKAQITFFAAGSQIAKEWVPKAAKKTIVIDNSSYFRMQSDVPLVVPEVNVEALKMHNNMEAFFCTNLRLITNYLILYLSFFTNININNGGKRKISIKTKDLNFKNTYAKYNKKRNKNR